MSSRLTSLIHELTSVCIAPEQGAGHQPASVAAGQSSMQASTQEGNCCSCAWLPKKESKFPNLRVQCVTVFMGFGCSRMLFLSVQGISGVKSEGLVKLSGWLFTATFRPHLEWLLGSLLWWAIL